MLFDFLRPSSILPGVSLVTLKTSKQCTPNLATFNNIFLGKKTWHVLSKINGLDFFHGNHILIGAF